ncbi:MAG: MarR family transcriptional regulator [Planctomyces sp.]|nr:MarR family transcriptional regulator [Planctomyces sp.]
MVRIRTKSAHDLALALRSAYWTLHRQTDASLQAHGVTASQFVLLTLLSDQPAVTQRELVDLASSDPNTVRAMLVALQGKGLVSRQRHPTDGRAWQVSLTEQGRNLLPSLWRLTDPVRDRLLTEFDDDERRTLERLLVRTAAVMSHDGKGASSSSRRGPAHRSAAAGAELKDL